MIELGINVDHVATLRQARRAVEPDPVWAAALAELAGADGITIHLREDRRHIQDRDLRLLRESVRTRLNLEMANVPEMLAIALEAGPDQVTLVPEKREEITTEGGLQVVGRESEIETSIQSLIQSNIRPVLFIDPVGDQVRASSQVGALAIEFNTGQYSLATQPQDIDKCVRNLHAAATLAANQGLAVHAGHGLDTQNIYRILTLPHLVELNIGHSIVARALFHGFEAAVREMKEILLRFSANA
jgi:pyridoxine 5-phosphate synthase